MEMIKTAIENVIVKNRNASSMLLYFVQSIMFMRKCDIAYHAIYIPVNYIFLNILSMMLGFYKNICIIEYLCV